MENNNSKSIGLTQSQIKALENGATIFIFPIDIVEDGYKYDITKITKTDIYAKYEDDKFIKKIKQSLRMFEKQELGFQKGDKDVFIKEDWDIWDDFRGIEHFRYKSNVVDTENFDFENASQMTKEQSRFSFKEILDVRVMKVQDIIQGSEIQKINPNLLNYKMFIYEYNNQLKEQNINRTYEDNDYVFLVEIDRGEVK